MRLYDFISEQMEPILQAWEDFARTVETPLTPMNAQALRNHAELILRTAVADMRNPQSEREQIEKSHGLGPRDGDDTAAEIHAMTRLLAGFSLDQMVSEYRALRSSVLRLWLKHESFGSDHHVQDMIRFNEAIDQALVESIATYGKAVETTRKTLLAVLGHDLRTPLGAVMMAGSMIRKQDSLPDRIQALAEQICTSTQHATRLAGDLLDLARCNLGGGIPVKAESTDLEKVCRGVVGEIRVANPEADIVFDNGGPHIGAYDESRMAQVFSNLLINAIRHGDRSLPIRVRLYSEPSTVVFSVQNHGEVIPAENMPYLFNPGGRFSRYTKTESGPSAGLGLGLYIAAEIVRSHGGKIEVTSDSTKGTCFRVALPTSDVSTTR